MLQQLLLSPVAAALPLIPAREQSGTGVSVVRESEQKHTVMVGALCSLVQDAGRRNIGDLKRMKKLFFDEEAGRRVLEAGLQALR